MKDVICPGCGCIRVVLQPLIEKDTPCYKCIGCNKQFDRTTKQEWKSLCRALGINMIWRL